MRSGQLLLFYHYYKNPSELRNVVICIINRIAINFQQIKLCIQYRIQYHYNTVVNIIGIITSSDEQQPN